MKKIIENEVYRTINHLFIGFLFAYFLKHTLSYDIAPDLYTCAFVYYFSGVVISRIGSLVVEPLLQRIGFVKFGEYSKYVEASKHDSKIELFSHISENYRTFASLFITLIFLITADFVFPLSENIGYLAFTILFIFLSSYRKQVNYVTKRIDAYYRSKDKVTSHFREFNSTLEEIEKSKQEYFKISGQLTAENFEENDKQPFLSPKELEAVKEQIAASKIKEDSEKENKEEKIMTDEEVLDEAKALGLRVVQAVHGIPEFEKDPSLLSEGVLIVGFQNYTDAEKFSEKTGRKLTNVSALTYAKGFSGNSSAAVLLKVTKEYGAK